MIDVLLETNSIDWITEQKEKWEHYSLNITRGLRLQDYIIINS